VAKSTQKPGGGEAPVPPAEQSVRSLKFLTSPFNIRNFLTLAQILFNNFMQDEIIACIKKLLITRYTFLILGTFAYGESGIGVHRIEIFCYFL
jgi:hypothetical protein